MDFKEDNTCQKSTIPLYFIPIKKLEAIGLNFQIFQDA